MPFSAGDRLGHYEILSLLGVVTAIPMRWIRLPGTSREFSAQLPPGMTEQLSKVLKEEVEERRLTNRAKTILQSLHGMSEEQAHKHLRQTSRKTPRKLREVAVDMIEGRSMNVSPNT